MRYGLQRIQRITIGALTSLIAVALLLSPAAAGAAPTPGHAVPGGSATASIVNGDSAGATIRFDTAGEAIDAHDGGIQRFGNTCRTGPTEVRSSTRPPRRGSNAATGSTSGCFRPHVVYNTATHRYVLWVNSYDNTVDYHVFTATRPTGPFTEQPAPRLAINQSAPPTGVNNGDEHLFVDQNGTAYLVYLRVIVDTTTDSTFSAGKVGFREGSSDGESALFSNVQVTAPDGTVLLADDFSGDLANWDRPAPVVQGTSISATSCGGQPDNVAELPGPNGLEYLYESDLWNDGAPNESLAFQHWEPLRFNTDGSIQPLQCANSYQVPVFTRPASSPHPPPGTVTESSGDAGFHPYCDVGGNVERTQTFTAQRSGMLSEIDDTSFQSGDPNSPLILRLEHVGPSGLPTTTVATQSVPAAQTSWSPSWVRLHTSVHVARGERLALVISSDTTQGCYGLAYNDSNPHPSGSELYSSDGGNSWQPESGRDLHFRAVISKDPSL